MAKRYVRHVVEHATNLYSFWEGGLISGGHVAFFRKPFNQIVGSLGSGWVCVDCSNGFNFRGKMLSVRKAYLALDPEICEPGDPLGCCYRFLFDPEGLVDRYKFYLEARNFIWTQHILIRLFVHRNKTN